MSFLAPHLRLVRDSVLQAHTTVKAHPLRTSLGALAIFVAVATMTIVITALDGFKAFANASRAHVRRRQLRRGAGGLERPDQP